MTEPPLRFWDFELDPAQFELRRAGHRVRLERKPLELLILLVEKRGELVSREEIIERVWGKDLFFDAERGINNAIRKIRSALNDDSEEPHYVETVVGKGYRFIAPVKSASPAAQSSSAESTKEPTIVLRRPRALPGKLWLAGTGLLVAVLAILFIFNLDRVRQRFLASSSSARIQSLAVLPLENLSGDPAQEYFADGMTDALITDLAQIGALRVVSRTSVMRYKGSRKSLPEIARELSVDGIVEGTIMRSGDHVRITSQLIYAPADQHLWARSYERDLSNVLTLQGEVARAIAEEVRVAVTPEERARLTVRSTVNPEAYEANLRGRYFWNKRTTEGSLRAMAYFQQAVDKDQAYAPPYVGLVDTYAHLANWGLLAPREAMPKAKAAALKAVELDDRLAEAHVSLGMVRFAYEWDWPAAGKDFERALVLNPGSPAAHLWYSKYLMMLRGSDEALTEAKRAVGLDPVSPDVNHQVAWLLNAAGRYEEAIEWERRTLDMDPGFPPAHSVLASAYEGKGMHDEAVAEAKRLLALSPDSTDALGSLAYIHARTGERSQALRELAELEALSKHKYVPSIDSATVYLGLGDKEQAFRWLEKACEERSGYLPWLTVSAKWAPLRSDPRYSDLLRCMGLPE